jgi:four helix bundle protein
MKDGPLAALTSEAADLTIRFVQALPETFVHRKLGEQLLASGTSPAANYYAARRAKSPADFVAKLKTVEEEADESVGWLARLHVAGLPASLAPDARRLRDLFDQIVALAVASLKTTRARHLDVPRRRRKA